MPDADAELDELLPALVEGEVEFILVGGAAALIHGAPITTQDVDIVHRRSPDKVARLLTAHARAARPRLGRTPECARAIPRCGPALLALLAAALIGCLGQPEIEELELGVEVRLDDVEGKDILEREFLAVGNGGLIVDHAGQRWDLGDAHLRAVEYDGDAGRWWVAGDGGLVAFANDDGSLDWQVLTVPTNADIEAIGFWGEDSPWEVVLVGDELVLVGTQTGVDEFQWIEPDAPADGWGRLRDIWGDGAYFIVDGSGTTVASIWAVGEQGRVIVSQGSPYAWELLDLGVDGDLNCAISEQVHGDGVMLVRDWGFDWLAYQPEPGVEVIACAREVVGADRRIYALEWSKAALSGGQSRPRYVELIELDWQPRAFSDQGGLLVGDGGHVARWDPG